MAELFASVGFLKNSKGSAHLFFIGSYTIDNDVYTETINLTDKNVSSFKGVKNSFKFRIEKDLLYLKGTNNQYDEIWKKAQPFDN